MRARVDTRELRQRLADPAEVCGLLGLLDGSKRQPRGLVIRCPAHNERHPSCSVTSGPDGTLRWRCFSCGASGDALGLVAAVRGLDTKRDFRQVLAEAAELAGMTLDDGHQRYHTPAGRPRAPRPAPEPRPEPKPADEALTALCGVLITVGRLDHDPFAADVTHYLEGRHLLAEARADGWLALPPAVHHAELVAWLADLADHGAEDVAPEHAPGWTRADLEALGWLPRIPFGANRLCIPWRGPNGLVHTIQRRRLDGERARKYVFPSGRAPRWPFGVEVLRAGTPVVLVEGAVDTLALRALHRLHAVDRDLLGLPGVNGWRAEWAALLRGREVFVALDADEAGEREAVKLAEVAWDAGATAVIRSTPTGAGDWADRLKATG